MEKLLAKIETLTTKDEIIQAFNEAVLDCLELARSKYPEFVKVANPEIRWDIKASRRLGQVRVNVKTGASVIRFNPEAAVIDPKEYAKVIPHEVAHLVELFIWGEGGHNVFWRNICRELGGDGERTSPPSSFPGLGENGRRTRYFSWLDAEGQAVYMTKKQHMAALKREAREGPTGLEAHTGDRLMTAAEFKKAPRYCPVAWYRSQLRHLNATHRLAA